MTGFDIIPRKRWAAGEQKLIRTYFKGKHSEWSKRTLKLVRDSVRTYLLRIQRYRCAYCRRQINAELGRNEIDHVIAKALPGMARFTYEHANLVATCKRCNWLKKDHDVLVRALLPTDTYPLSVADYIWVHPYIHRYSDHIEQVGGFLFREKGDANTQARGKAVIDVCRLNALATLEAKRLFELAHASEDHHAAIMGLISDNTQLGVHALAKIIRRARPAFRKLTEAQVIEIIDAVRLGAFESYRRATAYLNLE